MPSARPATFPFGKDDPRSMVAVGVLGLAFVLLQSARSLENGAAPAVTLRVDPNTCPEAALYALPRLGPALVGRIVEARRAAPFRSVDDLAMRVQGIGPVTAEALRPYLQFAPEADDRYARLPASRPVSARRGPTPGD